MSSCKISLGNIVENIFKFSSKYSNTRIKIKNLDLKFLWQISMHQFHERIYEEDTILTAVFDVIQYLLTLFSYL